VIAMLGQLTLLVPRHLWEWAYAGGDVPIQGSGCLSPGGGDVVGAPVPAIVFAGVADASWALLPPPRSLTRHAVHVG
jgi:hypothetical protein